MRWVMPSVASSISLHNTVCSCLISRAQHGDVFPSSGHTGGSRAPFQTQHPLETGFEKQPPIHSFCHHCLHRTLPSWGERRNKRG